MTGVAAVRYALAGSTSTQRWVAPTATYAGAVLVLYAQGGDVATTIAIGSVLLFVVGAWLAATLSDGEPADRVAVTASIVGGLHRARLAIVGAALVWGQGLIVLSLVASSLLARGVTVPWLLAAVLAQETLLVAGVALGTLAAPPVLTRGGWALTLVCTVSIAELAFPWAAPVRTLVDALSNQPSAPPWAVLAVLLTATSAASAALVAAAWWAAWRRH